jgi:hypothetical protein
MNDLETMSSEELEERYTERWSSGRSIDFPAINLVKKIQAGEQIYLSDDEIDAMCSRNGSYDGALANLLYRNRG